MQPQAIRLRNLEFLRGLAALWVVAVHARMMGWIGWHEQWQRRHELSWSDHALGLLTFPLSWGEFGVPLFFVLSGYVIHLPQARRWLQGHQATFDTSDFYARRAFKLYPALVVTLLLTAWLDQITAKHNGHITTPTANDAWVALGQLLGLQNMWVPCFGSNGALWTLSLEMQFYLVYPLLLGALKRWGWPRLLTLSILLAVTSGWVGLAGEVKFFTAYHPAWLLGAWLADHHARGSRPLPSRTAWWALAILGALAGLWCRHRHEHGMVFFWGLTGLWLIHASRHWQPGLWLTRWVERLGAASYSIYLVHVPLLVCMHSVWMGRRPADSPTLSLAMMVPCIALGWLLYHLVEAPCNEAGKRWFAERKAHQAGMKSAR